MPKLSSPVEWHLASTGSPQGEPLPLSQGSCEIDLILMAEGYMDALEGTVALARCASYALGWANGLNLLLAAPADPQPSAEQPP